MWMYSGTEDTTRIHPEEIDGITMERWMGSITGNKDNPRGARRVVPLDQSYEVDKVQHCSSDCDTIFLSILSF